MTAYAAILKPDQADAYLPVQERFDSIKSHLRSKQAENWTISDLEQFLDLDGRELLLRFAQAYLDERGPGIVTEAVVDAHGQEHTHQRLQARSLKTSFGNVIVNRQGYGGRGLESLHPLDAELNLPPERYSHALQRRNAEAAAKESFDEVVASIHQQTGQTIPKRQAEECTRRAAQDFELFDQQQRSATAREVNASGEILALTLDGKGVPMLKPDLREATRKAAEERKPRLKHRLSKGEKTKNKRMATVAADLCVEAEWNSDNLIGCDCG